MRVLWVTDEPPDRGRGGGSIRQAQLLLRLADHADVDVVTTGPLEDDGVVAAVDSVTSVWPDGRPPPPRRGPIELGRRLLTGQPVSLVATRAVRAALAPAVAAHAPRPDVVCVEHDWLAPLLPATRDVPWTLTLHYLPSVRATQAADAAATARHRARWRLEARRWQRVEARLADRWDGLVVASPVDAAALGAGTVIPNGVDLDHFVPAPLPAEPTIVVTGSFNYEPNIEGAEWFVREVLPRVRARVPEATVSLVGRAPSPRVEALASTPGVRLHADVPDVVPHLHAARVAAVPIRIGSGTRLKALEAMACGRPVVGTTVGLDGLGLRDGHTARVVDDPVAFADAVVGLLHDADAARALAAAGREHVEAGFGWDALGARWVDHVRDVATRSHTSTSR